uniref:Sprouty RTK signaling antagonist 3 n=1 Tax=Neogobius melanostomus TaxID=47308 RepID=A0A8C6T0L3_9GOBI
MDPSDQVLSLDQIRAIRANNDYVERPLDRVYPVHGPPALPRSHSQHAHLTRSSTVSSTLSRTSAASDQRLLAHLTPSHSGLGSVVRSQPKGDLKQDLSFGKGISEDELGQHMFICERCGRCKCQECCSPRRLPSCWVCEQRCLCSPESLVEYGTCLCCVKGLFYHCSAEDDEDSCADRPCSCSTPHSCSRFTAMASLSVCLPCLCCYPRATRPGCRCTNTNTVCRKISAANPPPP